MRRVEGSFFQSCLSLENDCLVLFASVSWVFDSEMANETESCLK